MPDSPPWSFDAAFRHAAGGLALVGLDGRWLEANPAACALLGHPRARLIGRSLAGTCEAEDAVALLRHLQDAVDGRASGFQMELRVPRLDGSRSWLRMDASVVPGADDRPGYLGVSLVDVTEQHRARAERDAFFDLSPDPLAIVTAGHTFERVNPAWESTLGWSMAEMRGRPLLDFVHPDDHARTAEEAARTRDGQPTPRFRNRYRVKRGGHRWLEWHSHTGDDGRIHAIARDVTEQQQALLIFEAEMTRRRQRLDEAEQRLDVHVNNTPLAVVEFDARLRVRRWSSRAAALFGWSEEEVVGDRPDQWRFIHEDDADTVATAMLSLVSGESPSQVVHYRTYTRDGRVLHCDWFMSAVFDDEGRLLSMLAFAQDVTARVRAEAEAAEREALFRATFEQAPVGIAHVGLDGRWLRVNRTLCEFFGHAPEQLLAMTFQQLTHPDDLDTDIGFLRQLVEGRIERYELRKRYLHRDGHALWAQLTVSLRRDTDGRPLHFISVVEDIAATVEAERTIRRARDDLELRVLERTRALENANRTLATEVEQRRGAEAALREGEARLRTITDNVPALIGFIGRDLRYRFNNAVYRDWFGIEPAQALGRSMREVLGDALFERLVPHIERVLSGEQVDFDVDYPRADGGIRHAHATYTPALDSQGAVIGFYVTTHDVTVHKQLAQVLEQRALRDELTGLPNRAAWAQALDAGLAQAERDALGAAVMFLDLDGFKQVNDTHGHEVGDEVLREFARRLSASVRAGDLVARLSGDEFVVLLEGVRDPARAAESAARAILAAMDAPFEVAGRRLPIRGSIGVAVQAAGRFDRARLLRLADEAMYAAKRNARVRFEMIEA